MTGPRTSRRVQQFAHPAPALLNVTLGSEHLIEALRPPFVVHQGAVSFGEGRGREHDVGLRRGGRGQMIDDDDMLGGSRKASTLAASARR